MVLDIVVLAHRFLIAFLFIYWMALFLYVLLGYFRLPGALHPLRRFLGETCDPYIGLWRRIVPTSFGPLDLSAMFAMFGIFFAMYIVDALFVRLH